MNSRHFLSLALSALLLVCGCEQSSDLPELVLSVDKETVQPGETVTFAVEYAGVQDVSKLARIRCIESGKYLESNVFKPESAGDFTFEASYDGIQSNTVGVKVEELVTDLYERTVCVMEFTGQWCAQCPAGASTIIYYSTQVYPERMCIMAFHNAGGGEDIFEIPQEAVLYSMFNPGGYPGYVLDMNLSGTVNSGTFGGDLELRIKTGSWCRLELTPSVSGDKVSVGVELNSLKSAKYRLAVYVVEDKIVGKQNNGGTYSDSYTHRHVVRRMLSESVQGDNLGTAVAGNPLTASYSFTPDPGWDLTKLSVCVLAIGEDGLVDNCSECKIN